MIAMQNFKLVVFAALVFATGCSHTAPPGTETYFGAAAYTCPTDQDPVTVIRLVEADTIHSRQVCAASAAVSRSVHAYLDDIGAFRSCRTAPIGVSEWYCAIDEASIETAAEQAMSRFLEWESDCITSGETCDAQATPILNISDYLADGDQ